MIGSDKLYFMENRFSPRCEEIMRYVTAMQEGGDIEPHEAEPVVAKRKENLKAVVGPVIIGGAILTGTVLAADIKKVEAGNSIPVYTQQQCPPGRILCIKHNEKTVDLTECVSPDGGCSDGYVPVGGAPMALGSVESNNEKRNSSINYNVGQLVECGGVVFAVTAVAGLALYTASKLPSAHSGHGKARR